jgi:hypothetical protein
MKTATLRPGNEMEKPSRRGSSLLEFVLAASFVFLPLLAGTATVGMSMVRSIEVVALNRDAGHMFAEGVDFSQQGNRNILLKIAGNLGITDSGGNGVIILSEIDGTGLNTAVCARQFVVGNAALRASSFVNPNPSLIDASGAVTNLNDPSVNAAAFTASVMPMNAGDVAYLAETYVSTAGYDWTGFLTGTGIYSKSIF